MRLPVCVLLFCVIVKSGALNGRAIYCRDPDTGKLYSINSTWASSSFCGNYRCVLKQKNVTAMEYIPLRQINITNVEIDKQIPKAADNNEASSIVIETKVKPDMQPLFHKETIANNKNNFVSRPNNNNDDRYLTDDEIKSIAQLLHSVKKSDLDAIVDIYNLAQDIYKEMDKATTEETIDETINTINDEKSKIKTDSIPAAYRNPSYWYEPLDNNFQKKVSDSEKQGSNVVNNVTPAKAEQKETSYKGLLTNKEFGMLPYYYPISNFQRYASYVHQSSERSPPCSQPKESAVIDEVLKKPNIEQKVIRPSVLLPYPFSYIHHYNSSDYYNKIYRSNPWAFYDYYSSRSYRPYSPYVAPTNVAYVYPHLSTSVADVERNSVSKEESNILDTLISKARESKLPEWKTPPLSAKVLDEVKANVNVDNLRLLKPLPLRKKLTLEKVGKLIKLDEFRRSKREAEPEMVDVVEDKNILYEAHLETITCTADTNPGFFRMGNLSEPYPDCCPIRIESPES